MKDLDGNEFKPDPEMLEAVKKDWEERFGAGTFSLGEFERVLEVSRRQLDEVFASQKN